MAPLKNRASDGEDTPLGGRDWCAAAVPGPGKPGGGAAARAAGGAKGDLILK